MTVTINGKNWVMDQLGSYINYYQFGTAGSPRFTTPADTSLGSPILTKSITDKDRSRSQNLIVWTVIPTTEANGSVIAEVGLFNTSTGSGMFARSVIPDTEKNDLIEISFGYSITVI